MENSEIKVLVTGAGGFIGGHLVTYLKEKGYWVRGVDIKLPEYGSSDADEFWLLDMSVLDNCLKATKGMNHVYGLAADMGGMGFIAFNHSKILYQNAMINFNTLEASRINGVERYFYSSSACVYPEYRQNETNNSGLKEEDAYPAQPQDAYGWEKLVMERLCKHYMEDFGIQTRVARFHNTYGPKGTWTGGREKSPAAICRKVSEAKRGGLDHIDIWGDGEQTRSFCYVSDTVEGIYRLMMSDYKEPLNIGRDDDISINGLADLAMKIAGYVVKKNHVEGPQGVRGRNSDNSRLKEVLGWEPQVSLEEGLTKTYAWIDAEVFLHAK